MYLSLVSIIEPLHVRDEFIDLDCAQRRLRSAQASALFDQSLHCPQKVKRHIKNTKKTDIEGDLGRYRAQSPKRYICRPDEHMASVSVMVVAQMCTI